MKVNKTLSYILIGMLFFQFSFAEESQEYVTSKKISVINLFKVQLRGNPWLLSNKSYTVMKDIQGTLTGREALKDGMDWVEIQYGKYVTWWVHKSLIDIQAISYDTQIGKTYTVYYKNQQNSEPLFLSSANTLTASWAEQIVWITSQVWWDIPDHTNAPWRNQQQVGTGIVIKVEEKVVIPQVSSNFWGDIIDYTRSPWLVPAVVLQEIQKDIVEVKKEPVMITTNFGGEITSKVERPWIQKSFTWTVSESWSQDTPKTITYETYSFRKEFESKVKYPWFHQSSTGTIDTNTWTTSEVKKESITSNFRTEIIDHFMQLAWAHDQTLLTGTWTVTQEKNQVSTGSTIVQTIFDDQKRSWTLYDYIFGRNK